VAGGNYGGDSDAVLKKLFYIVLAGVIAYTTAVLIFAF
jgi:hypothetical protein